MSDCLPKEAKRYGIKIQMLKILSKSGKTDRDKIRLPPKSCKRYAMKIKALKFLSEQSVQIMQNK